MFQNVLMDPKILKNTQISLFFQCLSKSLCPFNYYYFRVFSILYICWHVISYKYKYVLFHLNMFRLFQEIIMFHFFWD